MRAATISPPAHSRTREPHAASLFACVFVAPEGPREPADMDTAEALRERCARMAERVEWLSQPGDTEPRGALLDLGRCPVDEARVICARLRRQLAMRQLNARIGVGPTLTLAQLAALTPPFGAIRIVTPERAEAFTQATPVDLLARLARGEGGVVTAAVIARLRHYGLRTLGQVARLDARDPQALRRQFGSTAGAALATLAHGRDLRSLQPMPALERLSARLRFSSGASPDQALAALPRLATRLAQRLAQRQKQGRALRLQVRWESGAATQARWRVARPLHQQSELALSAHARLASLLAPTDGVTPATLVASLTLSLGDLAPRLPAQPAPLFFLPATPAERREQAALERLAVEVAEPLARRYGAPALYRLATTQPDAILPEDRVRLVSFSPWGQPSPSEAPVRRRRAGKVAMADALSVLPPQPHWW